MKRSATALILFSMLISGTQISYSEQTAIPKINTTVSTGSSVSQSYVIASKVRRMRVQRFNNQVNAYMKDHPDVTREEAVSTLKEQAKNKTTGN